eukprot:TRINITY_DN4317_c1_g1_i1.p1 TRINITY_DN4317_c1_g1~~TRINITY_DN4317_c1_g1_i1.p1  ORF type:complete len:305 (+),score=18.60 TRINITY_DN4317_c1_g1_i1:3-917(+)
MYYLVVGFISLVLHEMGHVVAAAATSIQVVQFKVFLYAFLIPVASTDLDEEDFETATVLKRILIISAGVYHNLLICVVGISILSLLPTLLTPFYEINHGIYVINSSGDSEFVRWSDGDIIMSVNGLEVTNINQLQTVIYQNQIYYPVLNKSNSETAVSTQEYDQNGNNNNSRPFTEKNQKNHTEAVYGYCLQNEDVQLYVNTNRSCNLFEGCAQVQEFCFKLKIEYSEGICVDVANAKIMQPFYRSEKNQCFQERGVLVYPLYQINKQNHQIEKVLTFVRVRSVKSSSERWILFAGYKQEVLVS